MTQTVIQPNLAAGELTAGLWARVDLAKFHAGVALGLNFFIEYHGGASNRAGTMIVGRAVNSSKPNRLIPFTFSTVQTYMLVFGDLTMRVIKDGAWVLETGAAITGISNANPGVISVVNTLSNGDEVYVAGAVGLTELNGKNFYVANRTAGSIQLTDLWGNVIDTTLFGVWSAGGTVARVYTPASPYAAADLALLKYSQSADTMTLTHPGYAERQLTRTGHAAWAFTATTYAPNTPAPTGTPVVTPSSVGTTTYNYKITAIGADGSTESEPSALGTNALCAAMSTAVGLHNTVTWSAVTGATRYNIYRTAEIVNSAPSSSAIYGYVGATDASATSFVDQNILPDFTRTPPQANNPFASSNYPFCSTYFQQRQVRGGQVNSPQALVLSQPGDFYNHDYSTPSRPSDSIEVTLASLQVNAIKHLVPMTTLIVLTASGAWKVDAGSASDAITPTSIQAVPQAYNGCSDVPPLIVNYDILYVQAKGSIVRDLAYNFYTNIYTGADLSVLSAHLFRGHQITEWCWSEEPHKLVWAMREDGIALTMAYLKEQDVYAWTRQNTLGLFKSTACISEGEEDAVYFIVLRLINGQYVQYIERLASRNLASDPTIDVPADLDRAWFVDCGLRYPMPTPAATLTPANLSLPLAAEDLAGTPAITSVDVVTGGSGYVAPTITVTDPTGSGALLTAVLTGDVITGVTVVAGGSGYTNPTLTINDSAGSGAVLSAVLQSRITLNASAAVFAVGDIGKVVRTAGGRGTIVDVPTTSSIIVDLDYPLRHPWPVAAGDWSMTTPVSTVGGLEHLEGQVVVALADGSVHEALTVSGGSVTLPEAASSIVIGLAYTAQLKSLYLDVGEPTIQGKRVKLPAITLRVADTRGLKAGPTFAMLQPIKERTTELMGQAIRPITGDERVVMDPKWQNQGQVCVQQDHPLPCTVLAFIPEISVGDT